MQHVDNLEKHVEISDMFPEGFPDLLVVGGHLAGPDFGSDRGEKLMKS